MPEVMQQPAGPKPAKLGAKDLQRFRELLLEKRRELVGDIDSLETEALRSDDTGGSSVPVHNADLGTDSWEREFTLNLAAKDRERLREIDAALKKIEAGTYGICEGTGKPIGKPRLEAQPWARHSIEYARELEKPAFRR
ncbi:MAG: TraR/DksA family transcriptional regulator [Phycisphaerae bacterium]